MIFTLYEIEAMAKRASRGAGYDWGLAEEAGKAVRWLTQHGLPGPELLSELLSRTDGTSYDKLAPISTKGVWRAAAGMLCPIVAGAAMSDRAKVFVETSEGIEFGPVAFPLLLAPFAVNGAKLSGAPVELSWPGVVVSISQDSRLAVAGDIAAFIAPSTDCAYCRSLTNEAVMLPARAFGRAVDDKTWNQLDAFARRTYAPATEDSRALGAGAGLADND